MATTAKAEAKLEELKAKAIEEKGEGEGDDDDVKSAAPLEQDIECPRCHDSMALCSDFDSLYYTCEACDFTLYTIKRGG